MNLKPLQGKFNDLYKQYPIVVSILVIAIAYYIYKEGKNLLNTITVNVPVDLTGNSLTNVLTAEEKTIVKQTARQFFDDWDGISYGVRNKKPYETMAAASDKVFVAIYNEFNTQYGDGQTFREWMDSEVIISNFEAGAAAVQIENRLNKLGLK